MVQELLIRCPSCECVLPATGFYVSRASKTGRQSQCKECHRATIDRLNEKREDERASKVKGIW